MQEIIKYTALAVLSLVLVGCQISPTSSSLTQAQQKSALNVQVSCSGVEKCLFARVNDLSILDLAEGKIQRSALKTGIVHLKGGLWSKQQAVYLTLPQGTHELVIRYYPISDFKPETFHVIHRFEAGQNYDFALYRLREHEGEVRSVFASATPAPLCVAVLKNQKLERRFCKTVEITTGFGEFKELKN